MNDSHTANEPSIVLRIAEAADIPLILDFIRQLADHVKQSEAVVADEDRLRKTLFGERQVAEVVIASFDDEPAGFALLVHNYSTFLGQPGVFVEDLFVVPSLRGLGIGRALLSFIAGIAVDRGCGRLEWAVHDWNQPAIRFYERLGAKAMAEWTVYRVTGNALQELAKLS